MSGRAVPLLVTENPRSSRMTLRIEPGGRALRMTVPLGLPQREIDRFLVRQQGWLMTKLARYPETGALREGGMMPIRGVDHLIRRTGQLRGLTRAVMEDGQPILEVGGAPEHLKRRVRDFLKREAKRDLEAHVARLTAELGRPARAMHLKDTRSRWGSCTTDGVLSFSWRIVMAPPEVIGYLAAHEVAHLKEMNHGPRFWQLCETLCPETARARKWLKQHGSMLHAIDFA